MAAGFVSAQCPQASSLTQIATAGSPFGPRQLNNECCVKTSTWRTCQCTWGFKCCANNVGKKICISKNLFITINLPLFSPHLRELLFTQPHHPHLKKVAIRANSKLKSIGGWEMVGNEMLLPSPRHKTQLQLRASFNPCFIYCNNTYV